MKQRLVFSLISALLLAAVIWISWPIKKTLAPTKSTNTNTTVAVNVAAEVDVPTNAAVELIGFSTADLPDRDSVFNFTAEIPSTWRVEYVAGARAINFYDPQSAGGTTLEKSVIFITYYQASSFQTPSTVDIKSQSDTTLNGRPVRNYVIEKKSGAADFAGQPGWRNVEHQVTDIRTDDNDPATYYAVAKAPSLPAARFTAFLNSMVVNAD